MSDEPGEDDRIRRRAYEIWMREGQPDGREDSHWHQAQQEVQREHGDRPEPEPVASAPDEAPAPEPPEAEASSARGAAAAAAVGSARKTEKRAPKLKR